jgi:hypothetical protein
MKRDTGLLAMGLCIGLLLALLTTKRPSSAAPAASKFSIKVGVVATNPPPLPSLENLIDKFGKGNIRLVRLDKSVAAFLDPQQNATYELNSQAVCTDGVVYRREIFQDPSYLPYSHQEVLIDFRYQPQFDLRN